MKKLMIMALMLIGFGISASAQNFGLGVNVGYGTEVSNPSFGVKALYDINESFTLAPSFNYYLPKTMETVEYGGISAESKLKCWDVNLDLHWTCYDADMYQLYPLVGISYFNVKAEAEASGGGYDVEVDAGSEGKFGVNLGFGGQLCLTENWLVSAEVKYQIISDLNQFVPSVSLMYKF